MSRKYYSPEFREQMVALARSGRSLSSLAREFEPSVQTLSNWLAADGRSATKDADVLKEVRRLPRENARLQEERDILAKATAWFAKETKTRSRSTSLSRCTRPSSK